MLVKIAKKIVDGMKQGLKNGELNAAAGQAVIDANLDPKDYEKNFTAIVNEYIQHTWDVADLTGPAVKPVAKKAAKKVAKKKAAGIGDLMCTLIIAGHETAKIIAACEKRFGLGATDKTYANNVAWYRSQLRKKTSSYHKRYANG